MPRLSDGVCADALGGVEVRVKILVMEGPQTGSSFANADPPPVMTTVPEGRLLIVGQHGVTHGHDATHIGFELTDVSLNADHKRDVITEGDTGQRWTYPPSYKIILTLALALFTKMLMRPQIAIASATNVRGRRSSSHTYNAPLAVGHRVAHAAGWRSGWDRWEQL